MDIREWMISSSWSGRGQQWAGGAWLDIGEWVVLDCRLGK